MSGTDPSTAADGQRPAAGSTVDDPTFALCLTHDVDRPYKTPTHALAGALEGRARYHLGTLRRPDNPYWTFPDLMDLESSLGVRSAFYLLNEPNLLVERPMHEWVEPAAWVQHHFRYDVRSPDIARLVGALDAGGWEVGLHGSYHTDRDQDRLAHELTVLESVLGHPVVGGRQHYLRLSIPETWASHRRLGLRYDASLGSSREVGFRDGYRPLAPFDDAFLVFPLTLMEVALEGVADTLAGRWAACESLLEEAAANRAVMTVLWHPRFFNEAEFPGYRRLYRRLVERALELGAWVGPPAECCALLDDGVFDSSPLELVTPSGDGVAARR